jgi:hypothetical protein
VNDELSIGQTDDIGISLARLFGTAHRIGRHHSLRRPVKIFDHALPLATKGGN